MPLGIDFGQIFLHLFNVAILFGGLYLLLYKPVNNFMKKRADHYKEVDEAANAKLADAEAKVKEYEEKIAAADAEIAENKKTAAAELETFRENKKKEAEREAASILSSAEKKAEAERAGKRVRCIVVRHSAQGHHISRRAPERDRKHRNCRLRRWHLAKS